MLSICQPTYAQKSFSLIAGAGFAELIHVGARYQQEQASGTQSIGLPGHSLTSHNADIFIPFWKRILLSSRKNPGTSDGTLPI